MVIVSIVVSITITVINMAIKTRTLITTYDINYSDTELLMIINFMAKCKKIKETIKKVKAYKEN